MNNTICIYEATMYMFNETNLVVFILKKDIYSIFLFFGNIVKKYTKLELYIIKFLFSLIKDSNVVW